MVSEEHTATSATAWVVDRPTLIVNRSRARRNVQRMHAKASRAGATLRPHFKTHNSHVIGRLYRECGISAITVSSIQMAEYFADDGWRDITLAFPPNLRQIDQLRGLANRCRLNVIVDSSGLVEQLVQGGLADVSVWIDVDTGYGRTGIPAADRDAIVDLGHFVRRQPRLRLAGLLCHAGHTYAARDVDEVRKIWSDTLAELRARAADLALSEAGPVQISVGDTPGCSIVEDLSGVDEVRPGNFVFYDLQQLRLNACRSEDISLAVACPVVAKYPARAEVVVHGGAIHLSKDHAVDFAGAPYFGCLLDVNDGWALVPPDEARVTSLSQEHGVIRASPKVLQTIELGDTLHIVPAHACLAANSSSASQMILAPEESP